MLDCEHGLMSFIRRLSSGGGGGAGSSHFSKHHSNSITSVLYMKVALPFAGLNIVCPSRQ